LKTFYTTSIALKDVWNGIVILGGAIAHASASRFLLARPVKPKEEITSITVTLAEEEEVAAGCRQSQRYREARWRPRAGRARANAARTIPIATERGCEAQTYD